MGKGFMSECMKCHLTFEGYYGAGLLYPQKYEEIMEDIKSGKLGEEIKKIFEEHPDAAFDASTTVLLCEECGFIETGDNLSVYLTINEEAESNEQSERWSVAFEAKDFKLILPWDFKDNYRKIYDYPHRCSRCSGKMEIVREEEYECLHCPDCKEKMKVVDFFRWD